MTSDAIAKTQLQLAQAIETLADHIGRSTGYQLTPVEMPDLPSPARVGMIACIAQSNVRNWGQIVIPYTGSGGGPYTVLAWYDGTNWTVIGQ